MCAKGWKDRSSVNSKASKQKKDSRSSQNQPQPAKKPGGKIPAPQSARIVGGYISGESIRKIAREEKRDRETIARIVRSDEVQSYVQEMREQSFGLGSDAISGMRKKLESGKDGWLNHQVLMDIGVVPTPRQRYTLLSGNSASGGRVRDLLERLADSNAVDDQKGKRDDTTK